MTTATADLVEVEQELRAHHAERSPAPAPEMTFWSGSVAIDHPEVEALDAVGQCQTIALEVERRFGFQVVAGFAVSDVHGPTLHFWNLDGDRIVDAARARRQALGYLGAEFSSAEVGQMRSAIDLGDELRERITGIGRTLGALLG
ncbi:MAG: hypothetical protein R2725_05985 [Solirubrobacterales bacterium]